jgi:putative endonuclease
VRQIGLDGEEIAADFLKKHGYKIISRNFHSRFGEIDIIAFEPPIVFVEVKLRSNNYFGTPLKSITCSKLEKPKKTAYYFLTLNNPSNSDFRFDAVEIFRDGDEMDINQVKNITL